MALVQVSAEQMSPDALVEQTKMDGLPAAILPMLARAVTCEFATLTRQGTPLTYPMTPYVGADGRTLDVSTGLTYPAKAERARRDPRVALFYSDPVGTGLDRPPAVLVQGHATVRDRDLQANSDRYIAISMAKLPAAYRAMPRFILRQQAWYLTRIWVLVTPLRITWWPGGRLDAAPRHWEAAPGTTAPPSDPPPAGKSLGAWQAAPSEWRPRAAAALARLGTPTVTVVDSAGYPTLTRATQVAADAAGFRIGLPAGFRFASGAAACLTFQTHPEEFTGQEHAVFAGTIEGAEATGRQEALFRVERSPGDWSLPGSSLRRMWSFVTAGRRLQPRLVAEAARRGQTVPKIRLPER